MGKTRAVNSEIQKDEESFKKIKSEITKLGYQAVAEAGGLKAYQTVWVFCKGEPVSESSEIKILNGVKKLIEGDQSNRESVINIINVHLQQINP